ncbi:MAG: hypothetical protein CMO26_13725 [Thiotrichales bacterium]|nr:hypothetical protein [Thiotrichales bacterium]
MSALLESNIAYQAVTVMVADWDRHRGSDIAKALDVTHQATLVMFKGGKEIGRVAWSSSQEAIEPLFKAAIW